MYKTFGIMGAMKEEINFLVSNAQIDKKEKIAGISFYTGSLSGKKIVVAQSGIGKVNAAVTTQLMIDKFGIDCLIFSGLAGSLEAEHNPGDMVVASSLTQHDFDLTGFGRPMGEIPGLGSEFIPNKGLNDLIFEAAKKQGDDFPKMFSGKIVSGDIFIDKKAKAMELKDSFGASATEMEGAALAQVCVMNEIPFSVIRTISDSADESANVDFKSVLDNASVNEYKLLKEILAIYE